MHCRASLQCSTHACHHAGRTSAAVPADVQAPMLHSTASSSLAISVLSQHDCVSALVAAAQQGLEPCSCQDGISHSQVTSCNLVAQAPQQASTAASIICTARIYGNGVLHLQAEQPESTAWLSNRLHQSSLSAAMAEPELLLASFEQL